MSNATASLAVAAGEAIRDIRVDDLGFLGELSTFVGSKKRDDVKKNMVTKAADRAAGDYFVATLGEAGETKEADPAQFYARFKAGDMTEQDFLACIKVQRTAALKVMGEKDLDAISTIKPGARQLRIDRLEGVEPTLQKMIELFGPAMKK